jgi:hypothetical protein
MIIHEAHGLAVLERLESAKDGSVTEALGDAAGVKGMNGRIQHGKKFLDIGLRTLLAAGDAM